MSTICIAATAYTTISLQDVVNKVHRGSSSVRAFTPGGEMTQSAFPIRSFINALNIHVMVYTYNMDDIMDAIFISPPAHFHQIIELMLQPCHISIVPKELAALRRQTVSFTKMET